MKSDSEKASLSDILQCPITRLSLRQLYADEIETLNQRVSQGKLTHLDGTPVRTIIQAGFISSDGGYVYPVVDGIVVLLQNLAIPLNERYQDAAGSLREEKKIVQEFYDQMGWRRGTEDANLFVDALRFEDLRPVSREYIQRCHLRVNRYLSPRGRYLLDVASGPIQYPEYLTYSEAYEARICVDISFLALQEARRKLGDKGIYLLADITNLPLRDNTMDGVVSLHTLYHVPKDEQASALREIYRVLSPRASAVVVYSWGPHSALMRVSLLPVRLKKNLRKRVRTLRAFIKRQLFPGSSRRLSSTPAKPYFYAHPYRYFTECSLGFPLNIYVWRTLSVGFTKAYVHDGLLGRKILHWVFHLEEKYPHLAGRWGQYPLFLIQK